MHAPANSVRLRKVLPNDPSLNRMALQSLASERFWKLYGDLPAEIRRLADKQGVIRFIRLSTSSKLAMPVQFVSDSRIALSATVKATQFAGVGSAHTRPTSFCDEHGDNQVSKPCGHYATATLTRAPDSSA